MTAAFCIAGAVFFAAFVGVLWLQRENRRREFRRQHAAQIQKLEDVRRRFQLKRQR